MKPQLTERVIGKDGKPYLVSTIRYERREWDEIWETAVFEGRGCLTPGRLQRFSEWSFSLEDAQQWHARAIDTVRNTPVDTWTMGAQSIAETRTSAFKTFNKTLAELFGGPTEEPESVEPDEPMPVRTYGPLRVEPYDGPNGRVEPGDAVSVAIPREDDEPAYRPREIKGKYLGRLLVDGKPHLALEIGEAGTGSLQINVPLEHGDRVSKIASADT